MDKFTVHRGVGIPLRKANVDTDQIVPAKFLKRVTKTGYEDAFFCGWREEPSFVLNNPAFAGGSVLVAGKDFGVGSSREHAVWAIKDYGIRVVISSRFGDIFRGNAGTEGLLAACIDEAESVIILDILEKNPGTEITVNLETREIQIDGHTFAFEIDDYTRWRLLNGLDPIGMTMQLEEKIAQYERKRNVWLPQTLPAKHEPSAPVKPARLHFTKSGRLPQAKPAS